ncbi:MAG: NUDIX domain-containing protein [Bacteroidales bacterium]|nr:NUDIX domain-containing protein [Bacteroidales bacterium]MBN2862180.1 NUDIX domain-containing protein [Bacteroidales bacterium]
MKKKSAGILLYRVIDSELEVLLVHPGGPFWSEKDLGSWSIPKGEFSDNETPLEAAKREFQEETGIALTGDFIELKPVIQKGGKTVFCFACEGDIDPKTIKSNTFEIEWPPKSERTASFPEIDRGEWFNIEQAKLKINGSQAALIDELIGKLKNT